MIKKYRTVFLFALTTGVIAFSLMSCNLLEEDGSDPDGVIAVETSVAGATVYLDGRAQSTTTEAGGTRYAVSPGTYDVLVFQLGYAPTLEEVAVVSGETVTVTYANQEGTEVLDDNFEGYTSAADISAYDNPNSEMSLETDADNKFLRVTNDTNSYAVFTWPVSSVPSENVVYSVSVLGYAPETASVTLYLSSGESERDVTYGFSDDFTFERPSDPAGSYEVLDDTVPGIAQNASTDLVIMTIGSRILVLRNGEIVIDYDDTTGAVQNLTGFQAEVGGQSGDPSGTNHGDFDNILVYSY